MNGAYARLMKALSEPPVCDDCHKEYEGPAYYSWDEDCGAHDLDVMTLAVEEPCTRNFCPDCAGLFLEPDDDNDPRRPKE